MSQKKPGLFDEAIKAMNLVVDLQAAPIEVARELRAAARVLRAAGRTDIRTTAFDDGEPGYTTDNLELARAILAARRLSDRADRGKK